MGCAAHAHPVSEYVDSNDCDDRFADEEQLFQWVYQWPSFPDRERKGSPEGAGTVLCRQANRNHYVFAQKRGDDDGYNDRGSTPPEDFDGDEFESCHVSG